MNDLKLRLKPHWNEGTVDYMWLYYEYPAEELTTSPEIDYGDQGFGGLCPFPEYDHFSLTDDKGEIEYELKDSPSDYQGIEYKGIYFSRPAEGQVKWSYRLKTRVLPEEYVASPYYDFRNEPLGVNGAGYFAFMLPPGRKEFVLDLIWDMSEMPEGSRGVFNYACGDFRKKFDSRELRMSYFAAGLMKAVETENFGVYWFSDPDTDMLPLAEKLKDLYLFNSKFFNDENGIYRIFFRRDPFEKSDGGSAAYRSFMAGYSAYGTTKWDRMYTLLCHEMIHNWPMMDDSITGTATWYNEGCAEYYSTMLPLRAGFASTEYEAVQINEKLGERYYDNPLRELSNMELARVQWQDRRGQVVPYGRGMIYLANTDAELKRAGKPSIDTIITSYNWDIQITLENWENFIRENLGEEGIRKFEEMKSGKLIIPDPDAFDGKFEFYEHEVEKDGITMTSYRCRAKQK